MQEKVQIFSPIKQRILQFVEILGISKREFYAKTGISRGTLESSTGITEETLAKFIEVYQNISSSWLLKGEGEMITSHFINKSLVVNDPPEAYGNKLPPGPCQQCNLRERLLAAKDETIKSLHAVINANNIEM